MNNLKKNLYKMLILCLIAGITYCIEPFFNIPRELMESLVSTSGKQDENLKQEIEYCILVDNISRENENLLNDWFRNTESIFLIKEIQKINFKEYIPTSSKLSFLFRGSSKKRDFEKFLITNLSKFKLQYKGMTNNLLLFQSKYVPFKKNLDVKEPRLIALLQKQQQINLQIFAGDVVDFLEEITFLLPEQKKNIYDISLDLLTMKFSLLPITINNKIYFFGCHYRNEIPQKVFKIF